ncbi:AIR synthase related protein, partial [Acinetobacter sp. RF14B]|uniref:AIR synthase related protein n=1 Tax=Acinetobacter sp. RF14B TaxID=2650965 RepID=UPI00116DE906
MAEFSIIDSYFNRRNLNSVDLGVGDDSAVLTPPPQQQLVICTDTSVAGRHFPLETDPHAIGWKSVAVNLSDIAAMGATPHSILLALSLPQIDHAWLKAFSESLRMQSNGFLSQAPHPRALGSALTHPHITTDYSEALMEFI